MLIAKYKHFNEIYIKKDIIGKNVILQNIRDKGDIVKFPVSLYHDEFIQLELIKGGKE